MSIRVSAFTIEIGVAQTLEIACAEDREFRLTFTSSGTALDMTGATAIVLTVRNRVTGFLVFARSYSGFQGASTAGTPRFQVLQADTSTQSDGPYDVDVSWTDASGYKEQLLVRSTFHILPRVGDASDPLTTPPAIPVVYGLTWLAGFWTGKSGGYNLNDGVQAYDGSLGATAVSTFRAATQGVTAYPIASGVSQMVASGWAYIGQHGGVGATGVAGVATGSAIANTAIKTAGYTASYDQRVLCNAEGASFYVYMPIAVGAADRTFETANVSDNGTVTVLPKVGEFVSGSTLGYEMDGRGSAKFVSDGSTGWMVF